MHCKAKSPPAATGGAPNALSCCSAEKHSENTPEDLALQAKIPSRAVLARRFPRLRLNRYTGRWVDDASGARGDDVESLLSYIAEASR